MKARVPPSLLLPGWSGSAVQESALRLPRERVVYVATVLLNLLVLLSALYLLDYRSEWLADHPRIAKRIDEVRGLGLALLGAPPALVLLRNRRHATIHGNAIHVGASQIPELHETLQCFCGRLGMHEMPELYVADREIEGPSAAYASWQRHFIVIRPVYLEVPLESVRDVYEFEIGRELGRIRLGHTRWWDELLIVYVLKIPLLRNPLLHMRTYAHDRYAAWLAPHSLPGLIVSASGRHLLHSVNVHAFVAQAESDRGFWPWLASLTRTSPHVTSRTRALFEAGLYARDAVAAPRATSHPAPERIAT